MHSVDRKMKLTYEINILEPYINWIYFYFAWQLKDPTEQERIKVEAESFLRNCLGRYKAYGLFVIADAYSVDEDIIVELGDKTFTLPMLRQQQEGSDYLCLSDFLLPQSSSDKDKIGLFATSVDKGMETDFNDDPYQKMMAQLLADRLAEAAAERMHEEVRRHYWGYAPDEHLSIKELHQENFQGIRPAVGYPSLPDASLNFLLDEILDMKQIGISLTESGAMRPHASVSGLMINHPKSRYFSVGKIADDQLVNYASRRQMPVSTIRKFLSANL